ncbi:fatty acid desaturase [Thalassospira mesophila]|uniref:Fatty acid desaturase n=1 Tax=Thalassospira mesophila TaxID=1293891 RepID=A0A1Y2KVE4_9PROT|nr:fatty acid desaturase [Thalassospira mesophila]
MTADTGAVNDPQSGRDWVRILARYRDPSQLRSIIELLITLVPFASLMALAWWSLSISYMLAAVISTLNGAFLVRLFVIQHDFGHRSFFRSRQTNDWTGRVLGVLTMTPYDVWRKKHSIHHASAGNLDHRGIGDVITLTVAEYRSRSRAGRIGYRLYRHPLVLFGIVPTYLFFLENRVPVGLMQSGSSWFSAMTTNAVLASLLGAAIWMAGVVPVLLTVLPTALVGASVGVWLFYVQHQFEDTSWEWASAWELHVAAMEGSSYYVLPPVLRWFTANIGIHHVHHLYCRIPFYRLSEVMHDHQALSHTQRLTLRQSLGCARRHLWDENSRKLLSFADARRA